MKNYIVVYKETARAAAYVKGERTRFTDGQLQISSEEHGLIFLTPLDLIHHVLLADGEVVTFKDPLNK